MSPPDPLPAANDVEALRAQVEQLAAQLSEEYKMASIGRLLAGIVHEINSPIVPHVSRSLLVASAIGICRTCR